MFDLHLFIFTIICMIAHTTGMNHLKNIFVVSLVAGGNFKELLQYSRNDSILNSSGGFLAYFGNISCDSSLDILYMTEQLYHRQIRRYLHCSIE